MKKRMFILPVLFVSSSVFAVNTVNIAKTSLKDAIVHAEKFAQESEKKLSDVLPNFKKDYVDIKKIIEKGEIKRINMPVINPDQVDGFVNSLKKGELDIKKPYARDKFRMGRFPKDLLKRPKAIRGKWLKQGLRDGDLKDDKVIVAEKWVAAKNLIPIQSQIWLSKVVRDIAQWGDLKSQKSRERKTVIVFGRGKKLQILDGNHHWAKVFFTGRDLLVRVVVVKLPKKLFLDVARSYGNAMGNEQQK